MRNAELDEAQAGMETALYETPVWTSPLEQHHGYVLAVLWFCYGCCSGRCLSQKRSCYGCHASQEWINHWIFFQPLSSHLAYPGFSEQCRQCEQWDNWCCEQGQQDNWCSWQNKQQYNSILKSRDITLQTKVHRVKAMIFHESCMDVRVRP